MNLTLRYGDSRKKVGAQVGAFLRNSMPAPRNSMQATCVFAQKTQRRGRDSNPRYGFIPIRRFSKPLLFYQKYLKILDLTNYTRQGGRAGGRKKRICRALTKGR